MFFERLSQKNEQLEQSQKLTPEFGKAALTALLPPAAGAMQFAEAMQDPQKKADFLNLTVAPALARTGQAFTNINQPVTEEEAQKSQGAPPPAVTAGRGGGIASMAYAGAQNVPKLVAGQEASTGKRIERAIGEIPSLFIDYISEPFMQTTGRVLGTLGNVNEDARSAYDQAFVDRLTQAGVSPEEIEQYKQISTQATSPVEKGLLEQAFIAEHGNNPAWNEAKTEGQNAWLEATVTADWGEEFMEGRAGFSKLHPVIQLAAGVLADPLDVLGQIGRNARWAGQVSDIYKTELLASADTLDDTARLVQSGKAFETNAVTKLAQEVPGLKTLIARTPETNSYLLAADSTRTLSAIVSNGKNADEQMEIFGIVNKYANGDLSWVDDAAKYPGLSRRILSDADAAKYTGSAFKAGDVLSPIESQSGQKAALVVRELYQNPQNERLLKGFVNQISQGYGPKATPQQVKAANEAAAQVLRLFTRASDTVAGVAKPEGLAAGGAVVQKALKEYQGFMAQYFQLNSIGFPIRNGMSNLSVGWADGVLSPGYNQKFFTQEYGGALGTPEGLRRGVGAGFEQMSGIPGLLAKKGGAPGKAVAAIMDAPKTLNANVENYFAGMAIKKGIDFVFDNAWRKAKDLLPTQVKASLMSQAGNDAATALENAARGAWRVDQIDDAAKVIKGNEAWRIPSQKYTELVAENPEVWQAMQAATPDDFKTVSREIEQKWIEEATGYKPTLPPNDGFEKLVRQNLSSSLKGSKLDEAVRLAVDARETRRLPKELSQVWADHDIRLLPKQSQQEWLTKFNDLKQVVNGKSQEVAATAFATQLRATEEGWDAAPLINDLWSDHFKWETEQWHMLRESLPLADDIAVPDDVARTVAAELSPIEAKIKRAETIRANATPEELAAMKGLSQQEAVAVKNIARTPRNNLPEVLNQEIEYLSRRLADDLTSGEAPHIIKTETGYIRTPSTNPQWFQDLASEYKTTKAKVFEALEKIQIDQGQDKGKLVERIKRIMVEMMQKVDPFTGEPPNPEVLRLLTAQADEAGQAARSLELRELEEGILKRTGDQRITPASPDAPPDPQLQTVLRLPDRVRDLRNLRKETLLNWGTKYDGLTPEGVKAVDTAAASLKGQLAEVRNVGEKFGTILRDGAYFNYSDKRNFDSVLSMGYAYPYWYTRQMAQTARRAIQNPHFVMAMNMAHDKIVELSESQDVPDWLKDNLNVRTEGGGLLSFPIFNQFDPTSSFWREDFKDPVQAQDPAGKVYQTMAEFGPGSPHTAIPHILGMLAYKQYESTGDEKYADLAHSYASRFGLTSTLVESATGFAPETLVSPVLGQYNLLSVDTPNGKMFVGTKYDKNAIVRELANMLDQGIITSPEQYQEVLNLVNAPYDKRYRDDPAYAQAWEIYRQAVERKRQNGIWTQTEDGLGIPGPVLLSWGIGPTGRYRTKVDMEIIESQEGYNQLRQQKDTLDPDAYREAVREFWTSADNAQYALYSFGKSSGAEQDESYAWSVMSRVGKGRVDNAFLEAANMDADLLGEFYDAKGIPPNWSKAEYDTFMTSIQTLGATLALPDAATAAEWKLASERYKEKEKFLEGQFDETTRELYDTYRFGGVDQKEFLAKHPDLQAVIDSDLQFLMNDEVNGQKILSAYYASEKVIEKYYWTQFNAEHEKPKLVYEQYLAGLEAGKIDPVAKEWAKDFYKENKEVIDQYRKDKKEFSAGMADQIADYQLTLPDVKEPQLREDMAGGDKFTAELETAKAELSAEGQMEGAEPQTSAEKLAEAAIEKYRTQYEEEQKLETAKNSYLTGENRNNYETLLHEEIFSQAGFDPDGALDRFYATHPDGWNVYPTYDSQGELLQYMGEAKMLREAILTDTGNHWTQVLAYVRTLSPEDMAQLKFSIPDIEWVAAHASQWDDGPSEAARADVVGVNVKFNHDGTITIARMSNKEYFGQSDPGEGYTGAGGLSGGGTGGAPPQERYYTPRPSGGRRRRGTSGGSGGQQYTTPGGAAQAGPQEWESFAQSMSGRSDLLVQLQDFLSLSDYEGQSLLSRYPDLALYISQLSPEQLSRLRQSYLSWAQANGRLGENQARRQGVASSRVAMSPTLRVYGRRSGRAGLVG